MHENKEGQTVPQVTFRTRDGDEWVNVTTDDIFKGKKVVLFALPGAFTPTCSSSHLPRYNQLADVFQKAGVDEIVCLSVNDAFVMNAWKADQKADKIRMLPDGNAEFTEGLGMVSDKKDLGFGPRSWRYSMFVDDGVIKKMFIEPEKAGDPFEVSDADTMLEYLAPSSEKPKSVSMITKPGCTYCAKAKQLLAERGVEFEEIVLGTDATAVSLMALTGKSSTPQIWVDGQLIGGFEELQKNVGRLL